ncbi:hypothetical protein VTI74DRAFT_3910 [Chaetomium olivicolor]
MDSEKRTEMLHDLDMTYRRTIHECDVLIKDEEARRMKLCSMLLRDEVSSLKYQLAQKDTRIKELVEQVDDVRHQLESAHEKSRRQDKLVQSQSREIANLKEEISAFTAVSQDSAKILSEKLALSREVAILKPELEHLRSQLAHQKDVLAEKLALERQLNTLEVELANEKRAAQKVAQKQDRENQAEEELRKQVRELEKELAREKRLAEKNLKDQESKKSEAEGELQSLREQLATAENNLAAEKRRAEKLAKDQSNATLEREEEMDQLRESLAEAEKALAAEKRAAQRQAKNQAAGSSAAEEELTQLREELTEARKALVAEKKAQEKLQRELEQAQVDIEERQQAQADKVDRLRSKLRDAQEELNKCRAELEKAQERTVKIPSVATTTVPLKSAGVKANPKKKRSADEISADDKVLMTPGTADDRPKRPLKKRGFDLSMVGGKSEFSITPFLNKTVNLDDASKPAKDTSTPTAPVQFRGAEEATTATAIPEEPTPALSSATRPSAPKLIEKRPRGRPRKEPLSDSGPSKKNLTARKAKAPRLEPTLEKVAEEPDDGDDNNNDQDGHDDSATHDQENRSTSLNSSGSAPTTKTTSLASIPEKAGPKKKKRKLLGANASTLFDGEEDEGEKVKPAAVVAAGVKRAVVSKVGGAAGGMKTMGKMGRVGGVKNAFAGAAFSPLKRDRRGVGASFLV